MKNEEKSVYTQARGAFLLRRHGFSKLEDTKNKKKQLATRLRKGSKLFLF